MADMVATSDVIALAKEAADLTNSNFITDATWLKWFNQSYKKFYNLCVGTYEDLYIKSSTINVVSGTEDYSLPSDVLKVRLLEVNDGSPKPRTLRPWTLTDKNRIAYSVYDYPLRYILFNKTIKLIPLPTSNVVLTLFYIPAPAAVTDTATQLEYWGGYSRYVELDMAIKALKKEESDTQELVQEQRDLEEKIKTELKGFDAGQPRQMTDVSRMNEGAIYPYVWGIPV